MEVFMNFGDYTKKAAEISGSYFKPHFEKNKKVDATNNKFIGNVKAYLNKENLKPALQTLSFATIITPLAMGIAYGASVTLNKLNAKPQSDDLKGVSPNPQENESEENIQSAQGDKTETDNTTHSQSTSEVSHTDSASVKDEEKMSEKELLEAKFKSFDDKASVKIFNINPDGSYDVSLRIPVARAADFGEAFAGHVTLHSFKSSDDQTTVLYTLTVSAEGAKALCAEERIK